jgi:hypothetical protein
VLVVTLTAASFGSTTTPGLRSAPSHSIQTPAQLTRLLSAAVPPNDAWSLAARLGHGSRHTRRVVNKSAPHYRVGRIDTFWNLNNATDDWRRVRARIVCETRHLYLYVQVSVSATRGSACASARFFEADIYPTDRRTFGSEWRPGVDDDPHITLFYGHTPGVGGYFSDENEYPTAVNRYSNQREMMFISSDDVVLGTSDFASTAAHEFQHMIHWHTHPQDEAWDNEGASMLAQVISGYSADGLDGSYQLDPVQLDSWSDGDNSPNYGAGFLWWDYLYERFGHDFIHAMMADARDSGIALAAVQLARREHATLRSVFGDWVVANFLNDRRVGRAYGYGNSTIQIPDQATIGGSTSRLLLHRAPYTPLYVGVKLSAHPSVLTFHGSPAIPVIGAGNSAPFWWSNRCDFCDTSMTRAIDLTHARRPELTFQAWYGIEFGYDYAYIEVSTDRGRTWQTLRSPIGTNRNPNGANYGNGITGWSGNVRGNSHGWLPVRIDLARFARRHIQLRFEYVTDDEYNGQSLALRDIAIHGAHFHDTVGSPAWRLRGFVPVLHNELPMTWTVRTITNGQRGTRVGTIDIPADGRVRIPVPAADAARALRLAIFGQAPKTTLTAQIYLQL